MATVLTEIDSGENHLSAGWLNGTITLCGESGSEFSDSHEGDVTCEVCRDVARTVFASVRQGELE